MVSWRINSTKVSITKKLNIMNESNKQAETKPCTIHGVRRSCSFCQFFQHEEIGDSDFGGVYAENATCSQYLDTDQETEEEIPNFDRDLERDCCKLDFWRVLEVDSILSEKLAEESDSTGKMDETYELFKERYNYA